MAEPARRSAWIPARVAQIALLIAAVGFAAHAVIGLQGAYLSYLSGIWLSFARDLAKDGVFYRDLVSDLGYGGTRYFPLFFAAIAALMKAGMSPASAGLAAGGLSLGVLSFGSYRLARASGVPATTAAVFAAAASTPYFALQTAFEVRADVLAAGLNLLGIALVLPVWAETNRGRDLPLLPAAIVFVLAFTAKVTAFTMPASLVVAAILTGRFRLAAVLGASVASGAAVFLALVQVASAGRALHVWGAVMLGGSDSAGTIWSALGGGFLRGLMNSHLIVAAGVVAVAALVAGAVTGRRSREEHNGGIPLAVPGAIWAGASATVAVTLASPGTVPANQVIEWISVSMLVPALVAGPRVFLQRSAAFLAVVMVVWMAGQNMMRARERAPSVSREHRAMVRVLVDRVRLLPAPILSESAMWPILAEREVILPDPFAVRIVSRARKGIEARLVGEIEARRYGAIILEFDPSSREGEAMYTNAHFTPGVIAAIRAHYRLESDADSMGFVFLPVGPRTGVDTPRLY